MKKKTGARILVMDDEPDMVRLLSRTLRAHGFQVFTMTHAKDLLEVLHHYRPDCKRFRGGLSLEL